MMGVNTLGFFPTIWLNNRTNSVTYIPSTPYQDKTMTVYTVSLIKMSIYVFSTSTLKSTVQHFKIYSIAPKYYL